MQPKSKRNVLRDIKVHEVSIVNRGAVKRQFAFRKADDQPGEPMDKTIAACLEMALEDEAGLEARLAKAGTNKKGAAAIKYALRILAAHKDEMTDAHRSAMNTLAELDDEDDDKSQKSSKKKADGSTEESTTMAKADMSPEVAEHFAQLKKANEEATARAAKLEKAMQERDDADKLRVCVEKARTEFPTLGDPAKVGALLKRLEEAGLTGDLEPILKGACERDKLLTQERGTQRGWGSSGNDNSAATRMQKAADAIAESRKLQPRQAFLKACEENPALYKEYEDERTARARSQGGVN